MASNRETARDALTLLFTDALVGTGKPCQAVYGYQVGDFQGQSPVVVVSSAGTRRSRLSFQGSRPAFRFRVQSFVLYTDGADWNEDDAEDALDLIEKTVAATVEANQVTASWQSLDYDEMTECDSVVVGGLEYRRETIALVAEGVQS